MARYFHYTTPTGEQTIPVPKDWIPMPIGGALALPDGTTLSTVDILSASFETRRSTPARDKKVAALEEAEDTLARALKQLWARYGIREEDQHDLTQDVANLSALWVAKGQAALDLAAHDEAMAKARNAERKPKKPKAEAPTPKNKKKKNP